MGLASGFVEPLESTSIHLIMIAVTRLMQMFPFDGITPAIVDRFNVMADRELEAIRDFIILHYRLTNRPEPFWQRMREMDLPASLEERIALFVESAHAFQASDELFRVDSWVQVMLGQRLEPRQHHAMGRMIEKDRLAGVLTSMRRQIDQAVKALPTHSDYISQRMR